MFDETFVRAWRLYLAGSQAAFTTGSMQLFQVVFARGGSNDIPWTRTADRAGVNRHGQLRRPDRRRWPGGSACAGACATPASTSSSRMRDVSARQGVRGLDYAASRHGT